MAAAAAVAAREGLEELERQQELITSCTVLWRELSDHFEGVERRLQARSEALSSARASLDASTERALASLRRRELSINSSVALATSTVDQALHAALQALSSSPPEADGDLAARLRSLCTKMDAEGFFDLVASKKKETDLLRLELPLALTDCIDPATFVVDAISRIFPVDRRATKSNSDCGWACVLILESVVPVLADPDPEIGESRPLVTPSVRESAKKIAEEWKEGMEKKGGVEGAKPAEVHTFLQYLVTFGIVQRDDEEFYRKMVVGFAWRKQMPKLAILLGLKDRMTDMIEELIDKGQQLDAINFAYEVGLQDKFPAALLLKSYLKDSKKTPSSILEDRNNNGRSVHNASRREQAAIRAVIKCIEDHKLEADFSPENLYKRLEQLKAKVEKKKLSSSPTAPASKRTRVNNGGPMPPAKAGRLTSNAYVSSFPVGPTFVRSPSHPTYPPIGTPPYAYDRPAGHNGVYGSRSPPAIRDPYGYPTEEVPVAALAAQLYPPAPMNYPTYGNYNNGLAPGYQQGYYR